MKKSINAGARPLNGGILGSERVGAKLEDAPKFVRSVFVSNLIKKPEGIGQVLIRGVRIPFRMASMPGDPMVADVGISPGELAELKPGVRHVFRREGPAKGSSSTPDT